MYSLLTLIINIKVKTNFPFHLYMDLHRNRYTGQDSLHAAEVSVFEAILWLPSVYIGYEGI